MGRRNIAIASLLVCAIYLHGCRTVNTVEPAQPVAQPQIVDDKRIDTDSSLRRKATVVQVREATVGNGLLKIQVEILNRRNSRQQVDYRFEWVDSDGMVVDTPMSRWTQISLAGKESVWITGVAPTPRTVDFRLKLIEPKD